MPKSLVSPTLLLVAVSKYVDGLPLYRQEAIRWTAAKGTVSAARRENRADQRVWLCIRTVSGSSSAGRPRKTPRDSGKKSGLR